MDENNGFRVPTDDDLRGDKYFNIPAEDAFKIPTDGETKERTAQEYSKNLDPLTADELKKLREEIVGGRNNDLPKSRH